MDKHIEVFYSENDKCFIAEYKTINAFGGTVDEAYKQIAIALSGVMDIYEEDIASLKQENKRIKTTQYDAVLIADQAEKEIASLKQTIEKLKDEIEYYYKVLVSEQDIKISKLEEEHERYIKVFSHTHVAGKDNIDTCEKCGLDIRDNIHRGIK